MKTASMLFALLLCLCATGSAAQSGGDPAAGRDAFKRLSCESCHSVAGEKREAPVPLPDLSKESPEAVAAMIVSKSELAPEALFEDMVMSCAVSQMTDRELGDIVAWLRKPN